MFIAWSGSDGTKTIVGFGILIRFTQLPGEDTVRVTVDDETVFAKMPLEQANALYDSLIGRIKDANVPIININESLENIIAINVAGIVDVLLQPNDLDELATRVPIAASADESEGDAGAVRRNAGRVQVDKKGSSTRNGNANRVGKRGTK